MEKGCRVSELGDDDWLHVRAAGIQAGCHWHMRGTKKQFSTQC